LEAATGHLGDLACRVEDPCPHVGAPDKKWLCLYCCRWPGLASIRGDVQVRAVRA
jgi:hypothetical protein